MQQVVKDLSEAIGLADAIEICRRWGGRELRVPKSVQPGDALALTLGMQTARRLVETFPGEKLQLPAERNALLDLRNAAIARAFASGRSQESIGLEYGLSRQGVKKVLRSLRERGIQVTGDDAA